MKSFGDLKQKWKGSPPPDLANALKLIWKSGILSELQKEYITDLLSKPEQPAAPGPDQALAPAAPAVAGGDEALPTAPPSGNLGL